MKNEIIKQLFIREIDDFNVTVIIQTDKQFYKLDCNRFDIIEQPDLSTFEIDNYWNVINMKIIDIGTDGTYLLIELADNRIIHYDAGGDCISFGVYPITDYKEIKHWLENYMDKLSIYHNHLSDDWVNPKRQQG